MDYVHDHQATEQRDNVKSFEARMSYHSTTECAAILQPSASNRCNELRDVHQRGAIPIGGQHAERMGVPGQQDRSLS